MFSLQNISIKKKLVLMQVFTSVIVLGLCFGAFIITDIRGYKERLTKSLTGIADVIGSSSISSLEFLDNETAGNILNDLKTISPDVIHAAILNNKGQLFATYTKGTFHARFHPSLVTKTTVEFSKNVLTICNPIKDHNEIIGTVCLQAELSELNSIKTQKYEMAAILLVIGVTLAFLLALLVQEYIARRLLNLVAIVKQVSKTGDYSKQVPIQGKDEITDLSLAFKTLMDQVLESHKKKDEFIGIASHELKTPLTSLRLFFQITENRISQKPELQDIYPFITRAGVQINKLMRLVADLLDVTKINAGKLEFNNGNFSLQQSLTQCIEEIKLNYHTHTITYTSSEDATINGDKERIEQVISNLLTNAIKYSPKANKVIVDMCKEGANVKISVTDFGIGISEKARPYVFERFYREAESTKGFNGMGLGLYIAANIVERHNGKIGVTSTFGKGSTFWFTLPFITDEPRNEIQVLDVSAAQ